MRMGLKNAAMEDLNNYLRDLSLYQRRDSNGNKLSSDPTTSGSASSSSASSSSNTSSPLHSKSYSHSKVIAGNGFGPLGAATSMSSVLSKPCRPPPPPPTTQSTSIGKAAIPLPSDSVQLQHYHNQQQHASVSSSSTSQSSNILQPQGHAPVSQGNECALLFSKKFNIFRSKVQVII